MIQQASPEEAQALIGDNAIYYEGILLGLIDGGTSNFNGECKSGLAETVRSAFSVLDTYEIWNPKNTAKFNIANVQLTEASNIVYAHCDVSTLAGQVGQIFDYEDPDQYIVIASRIMGAMINTIPELRSCVSQGQKTRDGYMVGVCSAEMLTTLLDASL